MTGRGREGSARVGKLGDGEIRNAVDRGRMDVRN
jgi:hypothetical protein